MIFLRDRNSHLCANDTLQPVLHNVNKFISVDAITAGMGKAVVPNPCQDITEICNLVGILLDVSDTCYYTHVRVLTPLASS